MSLRLDSEDGENHQRRVRRLSNHAVRVVPDGGSRGGKGFRGLEQELSQHLEQQVRVVVVDVMSCAGEFPVLNEVIGQGSDDIRGRFDASPRVDIASDDERRARHLLQLRTQVHVPHHRTRVGK